MRKTLLLAIMAVFALCISSCVGSKNTVSKNADLSRYRYVTVVKDNSLAKIGDALENEILFFDAVEASGLRLIGQERLSTLSPGEQGEMLVARYAILPSKNHSQVVGVTFTDYLTGRPMASFQSKYGLTLTKKNDLKKALNRLGEEVKKGFNR